MTSFRDITRDYIAEKRSVGFKMEKADAVMARIATLHEKLGCPQNELPKKLVQAWVERRPGEAETTRLLRIGQIRGLGLYMRRLGYEAHVIAGKQGYAERGSYNPHIFTDDEIKHLFGAADGLVGESVLSRYAQYALALRLLYATGMRVGEACALRKGDVDLESGVIVVRHGKNDKDRYVPLHPSMTSRLSSFAASASIENSRYSGHESFWSLPEGAPLNQRAIYSFFRKALWKAGISHGGRGKGPRVHDLRFTFACHRLRDWVRQGADINALLPVLAAYMGHADTRCTEYYLRLTAELFPNLVASVERLCGWMVPS